VVDGVPDRLRPEVDVDGLPPPITSGMIETPGATPAEPTPLPARAPTTPETLAPWLPMVPLSTSAVFV